MKIPLVWVCLLAVAMGGDARAQEPALPYTPSLDPGSMDQTADPCVNFYQYACGGWKKDNPIPADQTSWSVYGKLYQDNLQFLRGILEQVSTDKPGRTPVEKQGLGPVRGELDAVDKLANVKEIAAIAARLQLIYGRSIVFRGGSTQDP